MEPIPIPMHPPPIITGAQLHAASLLTLQGPGAYDAAVHCASVSAARRMMHGGAPEGPHAHRSQSMPSTSSAEGVPVRQALTEPPQAQVRHTHTPEAVAALQLAMALACCTCGTAACAHMPSRARLSQSVVRALLLAAASDSALPSSSALVQASSSGTQTEANSGTRQAAGAAAQSSAKTRKMRVLGKGLNSLLTKVFHKGGSSSVNSSNAASAAAAQAQQQDPAMEQD